MGVPVVAAISAPSTLAAELAEDTGVTLIGFLRGDRMTIYARADRLAQVVDNKVVGGPDQGADPLVDAAR